MKVGLILPGNIWFSPYVSIYTSILDEDKIGYDIISWNRDGNDGKQGIQFSQRQSRKSRIGKLSSYLAYVKFIKRNLRANKYDRLIVFGPQLAILLQPFLSRHYRNLYIFDYRDLSIEQYRVLKPFFCKVLENSYANVISSPGFKRCLPKQYSYLLSHNFNIELVRKALAEPLVPQKSNTGTIKVLTIGGIRDYSSNIEVVNSLANIDGFEVHFIGRGSASSQIEAYAKKNGIANVFFKGYYQKTEEADYIHNSTLLNIFYPNVISHSTALSNRFYNALIFKKPMIVTTDSIQGNYVEQYQLGLSLPNCKGLAAKIQAWLAQADEEAFAYRCNQLLMEFTNDYEIFRTMVGKFCQE